MRRVIPSHCKHKLRGNMHMSKWEDIRREDIEIIYGVSREYFEQQLQRLNRSIHSCKQPSRLSYLKQQKEITQRRLDQVNQLADMRW